MGIKSKHMIVVLLTLILVVVYFNNKKDRKIYEKPELIFNEVKLPLKSTMDINEANLRDIVSKDIRLNVAQKIIKYRECTGCISNMDELNRINGIGNVTLNNLKKYFFVADKNLKKNKININCADEGLLFWYGFDKYEIERIKKYKREKKFIFSNIELLDILGEKRYGEIAKNINYFRK